LGRLCESLYGRWTYAAIYFTTPYTLGQYLLMDYMSRKTKTIH